MNNDMWVLDNIIFIKGFLRPGNLYWKELHDAIEGSKVILTIRDNEHVWAKSWMPFIVKELNKHGIFRPDILHSHDLLSRNYTSDMNALIFKSWRHSVDLRKIWRHSENAWVIFVKPWQSRHIQPFLSSTGLFGKTFWSFNGICCHFFHGWLGSPYESLSH